MSDVVKKSHASTKTVEQWVEWARNEGHNDIVDNCNGEQKPGRVYCTLCATFIGASSASIKGHCVGYQKKGSKEFVESVHAKKKMKLVANQQAQAQAQQVPATQLVVPNVVVQLSPIQEKKAEEPAPKKIKFNMVDWAEDQRARQTFLKDTVQAFTVANIPLQKLHSNGPIRQLFEKYMVVGKNQLQPMLVDPKNLRETWIPKVLQDGVKKLENIIRNGEWWYAVGVDESPDPRPCLFLTPGAPKGLYCLRRHITFFALLVEDKDNG